MWEQINRFLSGRKRVTEEEIQELIVTHLFGIVRDLGHLGMTGRMFLAPAHQPLPKHAAVIFSLGRQNLIYEDSRYFGRLTLDTSALARLGPEPLNPEFKPEALARALSRSSQPVKVKLLDQSIVAGLGNIYASEALFRAQVSPRSAARKLAPHFNVSNWKLPGLTNSSAACSPLLGSMPARR